MISLLIIFIFLTVSILVFAIFFAKKNRQDPRSSSEGSHVIDVYENDLDSDASNDTSGDSGGDCGGDSGGDSGGD
jgi:flagellar basal body-associated protein FliL